MSTILLTTEGTYPFHGGGVSTWCDVLTHSLAEHHYVVFSVVMHPYLHPRYTPPPNVSRIVKIPLWGTEDPAEQRPDRPFSEFLARRGGTTESVARREFLPILERLLDGVALDRSGEALGRVFADLADYFARRDYSASFRARCVWEAFTDFLRHRFAEDAPTVRDAAECLHLVARLLQVLDLDIPRVDLTHSAAAATCGLPCVVAKVRDGVPYVLTEHGVYLREQYLNVARTARSATVKRFLLKFLGAIVRANYHCADVVAPVCRYNARWEYAHGVPEERVRVIYNGANAERFRPLDLPRRERPTVTQVGLIFPLKGTRDLILAADRVRKEIPDVEFLLYGSASDADYFAECQRTVVDLRLEKTVTFAGTTKQPEVAFNAADVVTLASISEGFPYTVVEAMLCGRPIVATDVGGVGEAVAECGLLVPPRRPELMAEALIRLLKDAATRADMGRRARERAEALFSETEFAAQYRRLYADLTRK